LNAKSLINTRQIEYYLPLFFPGREDGDLRKEAFFWDMGSGPESEGTTRLGVHNLRQK